MGAALKFKHADVPRQAQEKARLKIVHGPDSGATFVVGAARATIGRGEDCDIVLMDLKASRKHAELVLNGNQWSVRDLGSANGIKCNGKTTRNATLRTGDTISLGDSTLEFVSPEAGTAMLRAVPRTLDQVESDQAAFNAQKEKVRQLAQFGSAPKPLGLSPGSARSSENSRKTLIFAAAAIAAFVFFTSSDRPSVIKKRPEKKDLAQFLPPAADKTVNKSAEMFLKSGFREYREGNYLRARTQFETVLQIDPANSLASRYLQNCTQAIEKEVKFELDRGKKAYESGSLKQAKLHYEAVLRLLYRDQSNPGYIEARDQLSVVTQEMAED